MDRTRYEPGWMSLLDVSRTEERVCYLRIVLAALIGMVTVRAVIHGELTGVALVSFGLICMGVAAPLLTLSVVRTRKLGTYLAYVNNAVDIGVMTGVLVAALQGQKPSIPLVMTLQFGYLLVVAISAFRMHLRSSLFAAGFGAFNVLVVAVYLHFAPTTISPGDLVVTAVILAGAGGGGAALILGVRSSVATFDEAERIHRRVLNRVSDGLLVCDSVGRIVDVNAAANEVLGLPRDVLVGLEAFTVLPKPLASYLEMRWTETLTDGLVLAENLELGEPNVRVVDVAAYRVRYRGEFLVHVVLRDTTAERLLRDHRVQLSQLRSLRSFASGIAHEFNNMFASIDASSYVLSEAIPKSNPESMEVEIIRSETARATRLVRELHDLVDVHRPHAVPLDVVNVLERALVLGRGSSSGAPVTVSVEVAKDVWRLLGDEAQVVRALANLVGCAYSAMLDGGSLTIGAENVVINEPQDDLAAGEYVAIRVEDTGIGMPADRVDRAFDPFFGIDGCRWAGFALANVRAVVSRHGGTVELQSNLGCGTVYTVRLPATDQPLLRGVTLARRETSACKVRLLVVDDEPANRNSLARLLSRQGYEVVLAEDGRDAIDKCDQHKGQFDLVLLDLVMPGLSGKDVLVVLRARYPGIKVLLVTGFADQQLLDEAVEMGAVSSATKPFDIPELLGQVQSLTEGDLRMQPLTPGT